MVPVRVPGVPPFALHVHASNDKFISESLRKTGVWEPLETQVVLALLRPGDGFVDLGANLGYYSVLSALRVGTRGSVLACEPDPVNFALLERNLRSNAVPWVCAMRCAVSDSSGDAKLYTSADNQGDHRLYDSGDGRAHTPTSVTTLDSLCAATAAQWHLIKLDTQGSEARILGGASKLSALEGDRLCWILEFWPFGLERSGVGWRALLRQLSAFDAHLALLDETEGRPRETTLEHLSEMAAGGISPESGLFVNLAVVPRAQKEKWARVLATEVKR